MQPVQINAVRISPTPEPQQFFFNSEGLQWNATEFGGWLACSGTHNVPQLFWQTATQRDTDSKCSDVYLVPVQAWGMKRAYVVLVMIWCHEEQILVDGDIAYVDTREIILRPHLYGCTVWWRAVLLCRWCCSAAHTRWCFKHNVWFAFDYHTLITYTILSIVIDQAFWTWLHAWRS